MIDFIEYVVAELKSKRLSKTDAAALVRQFSLRASSQAAAPVLHPLLHCNTSDLSALRYRSTFTGEEFFLTDHQVAVNGQAGHKVLPGVAYLEMARAALEDSVAERPDATLLELRNIVWAQPIVVAERTEVSLAVVATDDDEIEFEIFSQGADEEIVHGQGRAAAIHQSAPSPLDVEQLKRQMGQGELAPEDLYETCAGMGLLYGPLFRSITAIHRGDGQVLAELRLPRTAEDTFADYVLHPSLMDGALQACVGLMEGGPASTHPRLPFALDTLRIVSRCTPEMVAWVRYAPGSRAGDPVAKLDIDLCDARGHVCVQLRGLSTRRLGTEINTAASEREATGTLLAIPVWDASSSGTGAGADTIAYAEHHVILCELTRVDAAQLGSLLPDSHFVALQAGPQRDIAQRYGDHALACFERIQAILQSKPRGPVLLQLVAADEQEHALCAGLSALLKTAALENPQLAGQLVLTTPDVTTQALAADLQAETSHAFEPVVRRARGTRQIVRWQEVPVDADSAAIALKDQGVYLITGGLGGLGLLFAKDILEQTREARVVL